MEKKLPKLREALESALTPQTFKDVYCCFKMCSWFSMHTCMRYPPATHCRSPSLTYLLLPITSSFPGPFLLTLYLQMRFLLIRIIHLLLFTYYSLRTPQTVSEADAQISYSQTLWSTLVAQSLQTPWSKSKRAPWTTPGTQCICSNGLGEPRLPLPPLELTSLVRKRRRGFVKNSHESS